MSEVVINIEGVDHIDFFGVNHSKLKLVKKAFPKLRISARGSQVKAIGSAKEIRLLEDKMATMMQYLDRYGKLTERKIENILAGKQEINGDISQYAEDALVYGPSGLVVKAKTPNQKRMVELGSKNDILFAIGPAGTGKTYTAVALAVKALKEKVIRKIILTRPAVEAGENLGFLPGDLKEKIDPYLRPLYDALDDMIPFEKLEYLMNNRTIEIAPLAFMRGRTLDKAFVILDEAQNATDMQLKMFLTRLGPSAKCIVTGDLTQIDLPKNQQSGLIKALRVLKNVKGIGTVMLDAQDVIRHNLVKEIIKAYGKEDEIKSGKENA